ncbi:MAG: Hpt domain-containing protein [Sulfitobacter sp.]
MNDPMSELPGLANVRKRFLVLLEERYSSIAEHALTAWDSEDSAEAVNELGEARDILHKIAGTAGSLGFTALGDKARACELEIIEHFETADLDAAPCPAPLVMNLDGFVEQCKTLIAAQSTATA